MRLLDDSERAAPGRMLLKFMVEPWALSWRRMGSSTARPALAEPARIVETAGLRSTLDSVNAPVA